MTYVTVFPLQSSTVLLSWMAPWKVIVEIMKLSLIMETLATMTDDPGPLNVSGFVKNLPKPIASNLFVGDVISQSTIPE